MHVTDNAMKMFHL